MSESELPFEPDHIYRVQIAPNYKGFPERSVYISSSSEESALLRVADAIAGLEVCTPAAIKERATSVTSARRCIREGRNDDEALRIFETSQTTAGPVLVEHPVFLMFDPGKWGRLWARAIGLTAPVIDGAVHPSDPALGRLAGEAFTRTLLSTGERELAVTTILGGRLIEELAKRGFAIVRKGGVPAS